MKIILTDNFGRDYPNEKVIKEGLKKKAAEIEADRLNSLEGPNSPDYYKVVEDDYVLSEGFKP